VDQVELKDQQETKVTKDQQVMLDREPQELKDLKVMLAQVVVEDLKVSEVTQDLPDLMMVVNRQLEEAQLSVVLILD